MNDNIEWVLVPREPTEAMWNAGKHFCDGHVTRTIQAYAAMLAAAPKPEAQAAGVVCWRLWRTNFCTGEWQPATDWRDGAPSEDEVADAKRVDTTGSPRFRIELAYSAPASHDAQQPSVRVKPLAWREHWAGSQEDIVAWRGENPLGIVVDAEVPGQYDLNWHREADPAALDAAKAKAQADYDARVLSAIEPAQQPAVVGDGVRSLPAEWRSTAARHRSRGTGQSVAQANGYDMAANMLEAALTPAATPGDDPVPWEWRWVDENDRAMTAWKRGDTPPMLDVSDSKGTMRVEVRIAQKEGNGNG